MFNAYISNKKCISLYITLMLILGICLQFDRTGAAEIVLDDFHKLLKMAEFQRDIGPSKMEVLRTRANDLDRHTISYHEFLAIVSTLYICWKEDLFMLNT